jgi:hypothetical protein
MSWFSPGPGLLDKNTTPPIIGPCNCKYTPHPRGCSETFEPDVNCTFMNDPFLCACLQWIYYRCEPPLKWP